MGRGERGERGREREGERERARERAWIEDCVCERTELSVIPGA